MDQQRTGGPDHGAVIARLVRAINDHDLEGLVACFDDGYVNETPVHPNRGFQGNGQVRRNWTTILCSVAELSARVLRTTTDGDTVWTEWDMAGTRPDGGDFAMRGVVIFGVGHDQIVSARFYLEPVEHTSGDVDAAVARLVGSRSIDEGSEVTS